jgi:hypothetical protein
MYVLDAVNDVESDALVLERVVVDALDVEKRKAWIDARCCPFTWLAALLLTPCSHCDPPSLIS